MCSRPLLARLYLELDPFAATEAVEVQSGIQPRAVEEVFRAVLGGYEAEAAVANQLLDRPKGHLSTLAPSRAVTLASVGAVRGSFSPGFEVVVCNLTRDSQQVEVFTVPGRR